MKRKKRIQEAQLMVRVYYKEKEMFKRLQRVQAL